MGHKTLHSTMLLLYRYPIRSGSCCKKLYIPLCFYYIGTSVRNPLSFSNLYIPLCFYYITRQQKGQQRYILSLHSTMLLLYLRRIQHRRKLLLPLHSTMLLLYPGILDLLLPLCYIFTFHYASTISDWRHNPFAPQQLLYIPLCFYYISSYRQ